MLIIYFLLGFVISYIGSITPSMLNVTAAKISIEKNKKLAIEFAVGVSTIVLFQAFFALLFLKFIYQNPIVLESIEKVAIVVFAILSVVFFWKARQEQKEIVSKNQKRSGFITGMGLSLVNMFSIPFYSGVGVTLNMSGWFNLDTLSIGVFTLGAALGTFFILYHYIKLAEKIKPRLAKFSKYLNYFLSAITGIVAVISLIKIL